MENLGVGIPIAQLFVERYPFLKNESYSLLKNLWGKYMGYPAFFNG